MVYTKNPIIINGIPSLATRPDLASRALVVHLGSISDDERKTEQQHETEWTEAAPRVLSALLDAMACALRNLPSTKPSCVSRMADFATLIEAASPALGWWPDEFAAIYKSNQADLDAAAIEADFVAGALLSLVQDDYPDGWTGTATRLLELLAPKVSDAIRRSKDWPQTPAALANRLVRVNPVLRRHGVVVERRHSGERMITIAPLAKPAGPASAPPAGPRAPSGLEFATRPLVGRPAADCGKRPIGHDRV